MARLREVRSHELEWHSRTKDIAINCKKTRLAGLSSSAHMQSCGTASLKPSGAAKPTNPELCMDRMGREREYSHPAHNIVSLLSLLGDVKKYTIRHYIQHTSGKKSQNPNIQEDFARNPNQKIPSIPKATPDSPTLPVCQHHLCPPVNVALTSHCSTSRRSWTCPNRRPACPGRP